VVTIVWGYSKTYPVAKIVSGSAFTLNSTIRDNINNHTFLGTDVKTQIDSDIAYLSGELSSYISSYHVYLYTYKPSAGMMTSQTEPNGKTTYYGYDIFERLKLVENADGNILNRYKYNYKP
jgi:YD repeat-containing protein